MTHYTDNCPRHSTASPVELNGSLPRAIHQRMANRRLRADIKLDPASLMTKRYDMLKKSGSIASMRKPKQGAVKFPQSVSAK
ncbi:MAG: hypothetical protein LJE92_16990 [Gammaproteobacteria bacterium]|jgi:hypothetical protein|nr:hypothetical protein [Gammaproteobacteria bacterium]